MNSLFVAEGNRLAHLKAKVQEMRDRQGFWESWTGEGSLATAERALLREYQKIIVALAETIRLMAEIDNLIPHWPLA